MEKITQNEIYNRIEYLIRNGDAENKEELLKKWKEINPDIMFA